MIKDTFLNAFLITSDYDKSKLFKKAQTFKYF